MEKPASIFQCQLQVQNCEARKWNHVAQYILELIITI